jgi:hypothetical protein
MSNPAKNAHFTVLFSPAPSKTKQANGSRLYFPDIAKPLCPIATGS